MNNLQYTIKYLVLLVLSGFLAAPGNGPAESPRNPMESLKPIAKAEVAPPARKQTQGWIARALAEPKAEGELEAFRQGENAGSDLEEETKLPLLKIDRKPVSLDRPALEHLSLGLWETATMPLETSPGADYPQGFRDRINSTADSRRRDLLPGRNLQSQSLRPSVAEGVQPGRISAMQNDAASPGAFPQTRQLMEQIGNAFSPTASAPGRRIPSAKPASTDTLQKPAVRTSLPEAIRTAPETTRPAREPRRMRSRIGESEFDFKKSTEF